MDSRRLYCYSHSEFDEVMLANGWTQFPGNGRVSTISICSEYDSDQDHWFDDNVVSNINLDFCDEDPLKWWPSGTDYDTLLDEYLANGYDDVNPEHNKFAHYDENGNIYTVMTYADAFRLVQWIDKRIAIYGAEFFIHCSAGKSRSQGVVRYILDTYPNIEWKTRQSNPCVTPNWHVVTMLKRASQFNIIRDIVNIS